MAECLFVDPIMDVAVLGMPDQAFDADTCDAFDQLVEEPEPLRLGEL